MSAGQYGVAVLGWVKALLIVLLMGAGWSFATMLVSFPLLTELVPSRGWLDLRAFVLVVYLMLQAFLTGGWIGWRMTRGTPFREAVSSKMFWIFNLGIGVAVSLLLAIWA